MVRKALLIRILPAAAMLCAGMACLAGCSAYGTGPGNNVVYSAQFPYSAEMYEEFLAKEIEPVTNELTTQVMLAQKVKQGAYPAQDAIYSAENSIGVLEDCIDNVNTMQPAKEYGDNRTDVLTLMENAKSTLEAYKDALDNGETDSQTMEKMMSLMQADYIALTSEFNVYYK